MTGGFANPIVGGGGALVYPAIKSPNFQLSPLQGWSIDKNGNAYFETVTIGGGVVRVTFASSAPASPNTGDVWFDLAAGAQPNVWSGSAWVAYQWGTSSIANAAITNALIGTGAVEPVNIASLTASLVGNLGVVNANPYFTGGDSTGWKGSDGGSGSGPGVFSVTSSPPAGCPFKYAAKLAAASNGYSEIDGDIWTAVPGKQYMVDVWVYSSSGQAAVGFNWLLNGANVSNFTNTFTITANTWTHVQSVLTAPASGINQGRIEIDPNTDTAPYTIYCAGALVLPQVPGPLIAAATITAAQIASGTITAALIAANTITAAQIAANTITAAQIAANTITASQIAANTIAAGQLAAGIVYAGIVDGTTITGAKIVADGSSGEVLIYTATPASGNLLMSFSGASGSDGLGNSYPEGWKFFGPSGSYVELTIVSSVPILELSTGAAEEGLAAGLEAFINSPGASEILTAFLFGPKGSTYTDETYISLTSSAKDGSFYAGGTLEYLDRSGGVHNFLNWSNKGVKLASAIASDAVTYQAERATLLSTGNPQTISTTGSYITITGLSATVGTGTYHFRGSLLCQQGGTAIAQKVQVSGPGTSSVTGWTRLTATGTGETTNTYHHASLPTSVTTPAWSASGYFIFEFDLVMTFTSSGTLAVQGQAASATETWSVLVNSLAELFPVGP